MIVSRDKRDEFVAEYRELCIKYGLFFSIFNSGGDLSLEVSENAYPSEELLFLHGLPSFNEGKIEKNNTGDENGL